MIPAVGLECPVGDGARPVAAPWLLACPACWMPVGELDLTCVHGHNTAGRHRWQPTTATFVVRHPALGGPITGRFAYPVDESMLGVYVTRMIGSLDALGLTLDELCECGHQRRSHDGDGCAACAPLTTDQHCLAYRSRPSRVVWYVEPDGDPPPTLLAEAGVRT